MRIAPRTAACPVVWTVSWIALHDAWRPGAHHHDGGEGDDPAEGDQKQDLAERAVDAREEDRDEDDRPELAGDPGSEHGRPEPRGEQAGVHHDRDERSRAPSSRARRRAATTARRPLPPAARARWPSPSTSEIAQPMLPMRSARWGTFLSITSMPAMKNRKPRPRLERKLRYGSTFAMSSTCGPIRIPSRISITTVGSTTRRWNLDSSAAERPRQQDEDDRAQVRGGCGGGGHAANPRIASPISFAPRTSRSTVMIAALWAASQTFSPSSNGAARSPITR